MLNFMLFPDSQVLPVMLSTRTYSQIIPNFNIATSTSNCIATSYMPYVAH